MIEKFRGTLFGAAIGDAMGMTVEELPVDEIVLYYGGPVKDLVQPHPSSPSYFLRAGENTSEFEIVSIVAKSLVEKQRLDVRDIIEKYIEWKEKGEIHTYVDPNFLLGIDYILEGRELEKTGSTVDHILPAIPVALYYYKNPHLAAEGAKAVVMITSRNEQVVDCGVMLAVTISELVEGRFYIQDEWEYLLKLLERFASSSLTKKYLKTLENLIKEDADLEKAINQLGNGSYCLESFFLSLFIFIKNSSNPQNAIVEAVNCYGNYGADTDSIGLITGALSGAYHGDSALPENWKEKLLSYNIVLETAESLYKAALH
ncbi:MAG: ADP-ribosylglycohydrolase family protein [Hydrogenothermaceae bacterium]|nr:ADP-ribosylglycohydrolase family protein [Hydrogenothermaceae bacterium]